MTFMRTVVLGTALAQLAACGGPAGEPEARPPLQIEEVSRFGWQDLRASVDSDLPEDAGILGAVIAIVQSPDTDLYVLDQYLRKVVVFSADGEVRRVVPIPEGEGPGEAQLPIHMALTPEGRLAILDYQMARILVLERDGELFRTIRLEHPRPMRLAVTEDRIWVSRGLSPGQELPALRIYDRDGGFVAERGEPSPDEVPFGPGLPLAVAPDGTILHSQTRPGLWRRFQGLDPNDRGQTLLPELEPPRVIRESERVTRIESARAFSTGIGALPDGTVLQTHVVMPLAAIQREPFEPSEIEPVLNAFDPEGGLLGQAPLPYSAGYAWHASSVTGNLLLAVSEPYPMVIEYRVKIGPEEG